ACREPEHWLRNHSPLDIDMASAAGYSIAVQRSAARRIAAVSARVPLHRVAAVFTTYLNQVYAAGREGAVHLDGQNVFVYRNVTSLPGEVDVDFGVGIKAPFESIGAVHMTDLPSGDVATTTHWGAYAKLGDAHAAVIEWCRAHGKRLAGPRWEIYGHATADEASQQTAVSYLLDSSPSTL
ncbi:MAG: GyrI-like domain-containing protein, partial [bacterium]